MNALPFAGYLGQVELVDRPAVLENGGWVRWASKEDALEYRFEAGYLCSFTHLSADFLLDGNELLVLALELQEGEGGPAFAYNFGMLNQCQARLRMPLSATDMNVWMYPREGAFLKPLTWGQRVDLKKVDRARLHLVRFSGRPIELCLTPLTGWETEPPLLTNPLLPQGKLVDEMGQNLLRDWQTKTRSVPEMVAHLQEQWQEARSARLPQGFSRWGGWQAVQWQATGYFRTAFQDGRWWLVDPDGHPFWSIGLDCVANNMDSVIKGIESAYTWLPSPKDDLFPSLETTVFEQSAWNIGKSNLMRAFGADWYERWSEMTTGLMRSWGFNTVANWSDWRMAQKQAFPYVRPLDEHLTRSRLIYRSFPDVFHADFEADAAEYASQLLETRDDPAFIGYFLLNEPDWGFSSECLAEGMLFNTPSCASRRALADFLRQKYGNEGTLCESWQIPVTFAAIAEGEWSVRLTEPAREDMTAFSTVLVERYFGGLNLACKRVDPNHLNLGARYYTVPPQWALTGMKGFDVFSMNCYDRQVPAEKVNQIAAQLNLPVMIGEWHFGALDVGLAASGIGCVADQAARGQAYRYYLETAAALPACVGVHYFTLYDEPVMGRFDGENYNIGFLDVCHRPYQPLADAALESAQQIYAVASGERPPFAHAPEYLPRTFL